MAPRKRRLGNLQRLGPFGSANVMYLVDARRYSNGGDHATNLGSFVGELWQPLYLGEVALKSHTLAPKGIFAYGCGFR
jgi:hypothetical protein